MHGDFKGNSFWNNNRNIPISHEIHGFIRESESKFIDTMDINFQGP